MISTAESPNNYIFRIEKIAHVFLLHMHVFHGVNICSAVNVQNHGKL